MIEEIETFYNNLLLKQNKSIDPEIEGVPQYTEILIKENCSKINPQYYNEATIKQILTKLDEGEYKVVDKPGVYTLDSEELIGNQLYSYINEQKYSISYRSPFDDIRIGKERIVHQNLEIPNSVKTISEAISLSLPGETIIVYPGKYRETIILDRSVEIKSIGKGGKVIIESFTSDTIVLKANACRIADIEINCSAPGDAYCARCNFGFLELSGCTLNSSCAGVIRTEIESRFQATTCNFNSSNERMISLLPDSRSVFDRCSFVKTDININNTITIGEKSTAIFNDCEIPNSTIWFKNESFGMIKKCLISCHKKNAIKISGGAQPLILQSTIQNCGSDSISIGNGGYAIIQDCIIQNSNQNGISISGSTNFIVSGTTINNCLVGIRIYQGSNGSIVKSKFFSNKSNGAQVESSCKVTIRNSEFNNNQGSGLASSHSLTTSPNEKTHLSIFNSLFTKNLVGVNLTEGTDCYFNRCKFFENQRGILVRSQCFTNILESIFSNNKEFPHLVAANQSKVIAINCSFLECAKTGIICQDSSDCNFRTCTFQKLFESISVKGQSILSIYSCTFQDNKIGITGYDYSKINIEETRFLTNETCSILIKQNSYFKIQSNSSIKSGGIGIQVIENGILDLIKSSIEDQQEYGLKLTESNIKVNIDSCNFSGSSKQCLYSSHVSQEGAITIINSEFKSLQTIGSKKTDIGVKLDHESFAYFKDTKFFSLQSCGILLDNRSRVSLEKCIFSPPSRAGIIAEGGSFISVNYCKFESNLSRAAVLKNQSTGRFINNEIGITGQEPPIYKSEDSNCEDIGSIRIK